MPFGRCTPACWVAHRVSWRTTSTSIFCQRIRYTKFTLTVTASCQASQHVTDVLPRCSVVQLQEWQLRHFFNNSNISNKSKNNTTNRNSNSNANKNKNYYSIEIQLYQKYRLFFRTVEGQQTNLICLSITKGFRAAGHPAQSGN